MASSLRPQKVIVVGAGPVGALAALYAARRGDEVEIYELRGDIRDASTVPLNFTKSINLALSERGINAMRHAGQADLIEKVMADTIPMYGRMIHGEKNGKLFEQPQAYDVHGNAIHAVDRGLLNARLLDALEALPNVTFFFHHKLTGADFKSKTAWFERQIPSSPKSSLNPSSTQNSSTATKDQPSSAPTRAPEISVPFDLLLGADGAHSAARFHLMKYARVTYSQEYIDTLWCEFHIPPNFESATSPDTFALSPNHLHIWPGTRFMFIAIPSLDRSFTCTLFAPEGTFRNLERGIREERESENEDRKEIEKEGRVSGPGDVLKRFFEEKFPGVVGELISEVDLKSQFERNPKLPLISIKCAPYHFGGEVVVLGDAAHAMVPFYGQGMNAGLEDVRELFKLLDEEGVYRISAATTSSSSKVNGVAEKEAMLEAEKKATDEEESKRNQARARALEAYTHRRAPDAAAINDLALRNYMEMRSGVVSPVYLVRKYVEETICKWVPKAGWRTQYARVSFSNERYSEVVRAVRRQGIWLLVVGLLLGGVGMGGMGWVLRRRVREGKTGRVRGVVERIWGRR